MTSPMYQNIINGANPTIWTSFTTTVTFSVPTSGQTIPSSQVNTSYYLQMGAILYVSMLCTQNNTSNNTGTSYLFNLPSQFTADTTVVPGFNNTPQYNLSNIGNFGVVHAGSTTSQKNIHGTTAVLWDATRYTGMAYWHTALIGNNSFNFNYDTCMTFTAMISVPIVIDTS